MKKQDPNTGLTIDVPDSTPPLGKFPYSGFWAAVYGRVPANLQARTGFSKFDIAGSLQNIEKITNGPYSAIVGEKLWKIGELLSLNQFVPATGSGGTAINYIEDAPDGGRAQIAAICLEPIVNALLQRASLTGKVGDEIGAVEAEYNQKLELMAELASRMAVLEESYLPLRSVENARDSLQVTAQAMDRIDAELRHIAHGIDMTDQHTTKLKAAENQMTSAQRQHNSVLQQIEMWQTKLNNAERSGNGSVIENAKTRLTVLNKDNRELSRTIQNLGQKMMRMRVSDYDSSSMRMAMMDLQSQRNALIGELKEKRAAYSKLEEIYNRNEIEMNMVRQNGARLSQDLDKLHGQLVKMKESQKIVASENESDIVRMWVNHLNGVYVDVEMFLFGNLKRAQDAAVSAQGSSIYQQAINASKIAEMEKFLSSVDMISDYLDSDEVKLLEQVARLGTVMNYLPGTSRVMALRDMNYSQRKDAYRNMIEEMLELGQPRQPDVPKASFEAFGFKLSKSEPLSEVAKLLQHLTDRMMEGN